MERISKQTAELARMKKVIVVAKKMYDNDGKQIDSPKGHYAGEQPPLYCTWMEKLKEILREKYKVHVEIYANHSGWGWILTKINGTIIEEIKDDEFFNSYCDALDEGLKRVLKRIKI